MAIIFIYLQEVGLAFSDGNFLNTKRYRKIGKRDTYVLSTPEDMDYYRINLIIAALAINARMPLVAV
jgi:hypothetical protein